MYLTRNDILLLLVFPLPDKKVGESMLVVLEVFLSKDVSGIVPGVVSEAEERLPDPDSDLINKENDPFFDVVVVVVLVLVLPCSGRCRVEVIDTGASSFPCSFLVEGLGGESVEVDLSCSEKSDVDTATSSSAEGGGAVVVAVIIVVVLNPTPLSLLGCRGSGPFSSSAISTAASLFFSTEVSPPRLPSSSSLVSLDSTAFT